jgi:hypothetical protein
MTLFTAKLLSVKIKFMAKSCNEDPLEYESVALNSEELGVLLQPPSILAGIPNLPLVKACSEADGSEAFLLILEPRVKQAIMAEPKQKLRDLEVQLRECIGVLD